MSSSATTRHKLLHRDSCVQIHAEWPESVEALRYLVRLAGELQDGGKRDAYEATLQKVERALAMREDVPKPTSRQAGRGSGGVGGGGGGVGGLGGLDTSQFGTPAVIGGQCVMSDPFAGALEQGLGGGGALLPERLPPRRALQHGEGRKADMWEEELGADLLPGLD
jgi:hypothetical protein